jgi:F420-non-reducing hydrogenase iron-sulfur subunit
VESMSKPAEITVFVCTNCARPGTQSTSTNRTRPAVPDFNLPGRVQQIIVPCAGRLQPEHILRAFESGSCVVSIIACKEDNCHQAEGSRRCSLRVEYIQSILREIGLGEERLLMFHLPGSASEDLEVSTGKKPAPGFEDSLKAQIENIRSQIIKVFQTHPSSPLQNSSPYTSEGKLMEGDLALIEGDSK